MITFDHRRDGNPSALWTDLVSALPELSPPGSGDHLVVIAAHPDDETLGAGGLIALAAAAGARVTVIVASDDAASHPNSPTHTPTQLAAQRGREVHAAVAALAPLAEVHLIELPDGRLAQHEPQLVAAIDALAAGCTHLVTPWSDDRHPDHEACARAGTRSSVLREAVHWQYPIWAWHWADPNELPVARMRGVRLDAAAQKAKEYAMQCHASQHRPLSDAAGDEPILSPEMLAHFQRDREVFVLPPAVPPEFFERLYAQDADPWGLGERFYELRKRAALLAALTRPRFHRAFEPGCATGLLTAQLAHRCDEVVAWDVSESAIAQATEHLGEAENVRFGTGLIPNDWPAGEFDLIIISEIGYYCSDLDALATRVEGSLAADGVLVACHWRHPAPMHPHSAGAVHTALAAGHRLVVSHVEDDFLLQVWTRTGRSVAADEGILS